MKKSLRWILGIAASPFVLFLLLTLLLYCPPIQRWAVGIATQYASEETGMDISIDGVRLRFPLDLQLDGVRAIQRNDSLPQVKDTLIDARRIICEVQLRPLIDSNVQVDIMQMDDVQLNTMGMIPDCRIRGRVGRLMLTSHGIDLKRDTLMLNKALLHDANLDICLSDTARKDTTETPNPDWIIRFQHLDVKRSRVLVHMPGDTINVDAGIASLTARDGLVDLNDGTYKIAAVDLNGSTVKYDNRFATKVKGIDFNHISLNELNVGIDSLYFKQPDIRLKLRACNAKEQCGLDVSSLTGDIALDSTTVYVHDLDLQTSAAGRKPYTHITGNINLDFNTFSATNPGTMTATIDGQLGKRDLMLFVGNAIPDDIMRQWHDIPAAIHASLKGNMRSCLLDGVTLDVPTLAHATVKGVLYNLDDTDRLRATATLALRAANNNGTIKGDVSFGMKRMEYTAHLNADNLNLNHFVPGKGLGRFSGTVNVDGNGTDPFALSTKLKADAHIRQFRYGKYDLAGATLAATIRNGIIHADANSVAQIMDGSIAFDGKVNKRNIDANIATELRNIDLYALGLTKKPLAIALTGDFDLNTNLRERHALRGRFNGITITDSIQHFTPNDIVLDISTSRDSTYADVACGDFMLRGCFGSGYAKLMSLTDDITKEVKRQIDSRIIDETALRSRFPNGKLKVRSGKDNPFGRLSAMLGYRFAALDLDLSMSRHNGINGYVSIDTLKVSDMQLDVVDAKLVSDEENMSYLLTVANGENNPNFTFSGQLMGELMQNGTTMTLRVNDAKGRRGIDLSLAAMMEQDRIRISVTNDNPVLGYAAFNVNPDNYISLSRDMRISADVLLRAQNGTGIQIYTNDDNATALQDITVSVNRVNIGDITSALPFMPDIRGSLDGDFHLIVDEDKMSISTDSDFENLVYEGTPMGNLSTQLVYMPLENNSHYVDGVLFKDGDEVATIRGTYYFKSNDMIDAQVELTRMPMDLINGFIPNQIVGLKGIGTGTLNVKGYVSNPVVNGTIDLSKSKLISVPYGIELAMDRKRLSIVNSSVVFDDYSLTSGNGSPLIVDGMFDFSSLDHMYANLHVKGENVEIIDAKETRRSEAYGKAFVNFYGNIQGDVRRLNVRAKLDVLPSTNLYYILRDSPITTDNRLKELVTFTDFSTEQQPVIQVPKVEGMNMELNINVLDGSHIVCWLNNNHTNYLDIYGSGELRFLMSYDRMKMTGRYTFSEGEMKYSLPVIPLKTFTISPDSYIEFKGDVMNPTLNITATEHNRANATVDGEDVTVDFVCGVVLTKTLQDMGLQFVISAPENNSISEHLNILSKEERAKLAVGMLTTGMYLDNTSSNITMNTALSSFLQQEINNIAGSALKTLDLSIGIDNSTTPDGTVRMDYSFKFAKRFWNNRVSVAIGGKIATGSQSAGKTPSFFDNVEVQYRLSDTSNQYLHLFYKHDVYDYLEGYHDYFGGGYMWKRKLQNLSDIFGRKHTAANDTISSQQEPAQ